MGRVVRTPFLLSGIFAVALAAPLPAQEATPAGPPAPLTGVAEGDAPGGVDFRDAEAVRTELARVRELYGKLDPALQANRARLLQRQQDALSRQRDFLVQQGRLETLPQETSDEALAAAEAQRDAARAAFRSFDPSGLIDHLREFADIEALTPRIATEFEEPLAAAQRAAEALDSELAAVTSEVEAAPRRRSEAWAAAESAASDLFATRTRLDSSEFGADERADLFEQALAAEEELVHHRMRAAWIEQVTPLLEKRQSLLSSRQQAALAGAELAEARLAVARRYAQEQLVAATRDAEEEVRERERQLAASSDDEQRAINEAALENSRLAAQQRSAEEQAADRTAEVAAAQLALAAAIAQRDRYVALYGGDTGADPAARTPDAVQVKREIEELQEQTRYFEHQSRRSDLRTELRTAQDALDAAQAQAESRGKDLVRQRDAARAAATDSAWRTLEPRFTQLGKERSETLALLTRSAMQRVDAIERLLAIELQTWEVRNDALALLRSANLFLHEDRRITREAIASGAADLIELPAFALTQSSAALGWVRAEGNVARLLRCLAALVPIALMALLARLWLTRRIARLAALESVASLPVRSALLLAHLGRVACTAAFFWAAPHVITALLPALPERIGELLHDLGILFAGLWAGLGLSRELLRPDPPERMVLAVDRATARRVGIGVTFLLWLSLGVFALDRLLEAFAWRNVGAMAAIDLAYKAVAGAVVMFLLLERQLVFSLLPPPERAIGRLLRRIAALVQPLLVLLVPTVVVLDGVGFRILAAFITRIAVLLLAAFPIGSIAYQIIVFALERWRARELARPLASERDLARVAAVDELVRFVARVAVILLVGFVLLQVTGTSFASLRRFFERPLPLQDGTDLAARRSWWDVLVALLIAFLALRFARHVKILLEGVVLPATQFARSTQYTITTLAVYLLHGFGFWLALSQVLDVRNLGYLVAALSVGIGFGLQEIISNFVSGLILLIERPLKPGDTIALGDGSIGTVRELGIRATTIQTGDNVHILVPNREFITQRVVNYDTIDPKIRIAVDVGVAYGSDVKRVRDVLLEVAAKDGRVMKRPVPEVLFTAFGESSLDFRLGVWLEDSSQNARIASDLRFAIDAAFARAAIAIPFPTRELRLSADAPLRVRIDGAAPPVPPPAAPPGA